MDVLQQQQRELLQRRKNLQEKEMEARSMGREGAAQHIAAEVQYQYLNTNINILQSIHVKKHFIILCRLVY